MDDFIKRFDNYLLDLWGVLWDATHVFPDAIEFCRRLIDSGKGVYFLSNTAEFVVEELLERFRAAGLTNVDEGRLITAGQALSLWFEQHGVAGKPVYVFGGRSNWENVRRAGAEPIDLPDDPQSLREAARAKCLVLGGLHEFTWRRMEQVVSAVHIGGLTVLTPNPDIVVLNQTGEATLPAGMIARIIESALPDARIERLGKPFTFLYEYAFRRIANGAGGRRNAVDRSRILMIGDSLDTDIRGANAAGVKSLLLGQGVHMGRPLDSIRQLAQERRIYPDYFTPRLEPNGEFRELDWR